MPAQRARAPEGAWSAEVRAGVEYALAQALSLNPPAVRVTLVVDHAWLKNAEGEKELAAGRAQMGRLRNLVEAGATIPQAYPGSRSMAGPSQFLQLHQREH